MQLKATVFIIFFSVFLFTPTFVMLVDKNTSLTWLINEIEEEAKTKDKKTENEIPFVENKINCDFKPTIVYHEYLNNDVFLYTKHYIDEEIQPPELT